MVGFSPGALAGVAVPTAGLRLAAAAAAIGCLVLRAPPAAAQTTACAEALQHYVGRPLVQTFAARGQGIAAQYFARKLEDSRRAGQPEATANLVTRQDLANILTVYRRYGRGECELRQDLATITAAVPTYRRPPGTSPTYDYRSYHPAPPAADGGASRLPPPKVAVQPYSATPPTDGGSPTAAAAPPPVPAPLPPTTMGRPYSGAVPTRDGAPATVTASPTYAPAPMAASEPRPARFAGGSVRKAVITPANPMPQAGFGLYVYILPEREVDRSVLNGIEEFHRCLDAAGAGEAPKTIALMILPVRGPAAPQLDTALSHDLVRTVVVDAQIDTREVYVVATNAPLIRGTRVDPRAAVVITLGRIAPSFVGTWLARLQGLIEQGRIESPATLALKVRSLLVEVNAIGSLIGVKPADAAPYKCL